MFPSPTASAISGKDLQRKTERLRAQLNAIAERLSNAEADVEFASAAMDRHYRALKSAAAQITVLKSARSRRSTEMYMTGDQFLTVLSSADSLDSFTERLSYLEQLRSGEETNLEALVALRRRSKVEAAELARDKADAKAAYARLSKERHSLEASFREYRALSNFVDFASRTGSRASRGRLRGFACPVAGPHAISNNFGAPRPGGPHQGDDMPADTGTPVVSVLPARVSDVVRGGWMGRGVIIRDSAGNEWIYAHLSAEYVSVGEALADGEVIGRVGCTGHCTGPHLHFEYHPGGGEARNPYRILSAAC